MILPAGGSGLRFGAEVPKQFMDLNGVPIIIRTLQKVQSFGFVDYFIVALNPYYRELFQEQLDRFSIDQSRLLITDGGKERAHSIENAMEVIAKIVEDRDNSPAFESESTLTDPKTSTVPDPKLQPNSASPQDISNISSTAPNSALQNSNPADQSEYSVSTSSNPNDANDDVVMIHDAVRPFLLKEVAWECVVEARKYGASNAGVAAADTMLYSEDGEFVQNVPERSYLYYGQTPDVIRLKDFQRAMSILTDDQKQINMGTIGITLNAGIKTKLVHSSRQNMKITTQDEVIMAEAIARNE
jgi:2-C-methyl-D-erythritol 4-phosphate cytidylyltransferase